MSVALDPQQLRQHTGFVAIALSTLASSVLLISPAWVQDSASPAASGSATEELSVPVGNGEVITAIQVRFVNKAGIVIESTPRDRSLVAARFDLEPGDSYDPELAQRGLSQVAHLSTSGQAHLTLEPAAETNRVVMAVDVSEPNSFFFDLGSGIPRPTALRGPERPTPVPATSNEASGISVGVRFGLENIGNNNQTLSLGIEGGENTLGVDLDFRHFLDDTSGYGINFANQRALEPEFDNGEIEEETPSGDEIGRAHV